jgi:hypothetical protein
LALSALGLLASAPAASAAGAVAFGSCSAYGMANGHTVREAENDALARCAKLSKSECLLVAKETNGCIAVVAQGSGTCGHFFAQNADSTTARTAAVNKCSPKHPYCGAPAEVCF